MKMEIKIRNICFAIIILICIFALTYGIYHQIFGDQNTEINIVEPGTVIAPEVDFDDLFDNSMNYQEYTGADYINKIKPDAEAVYTIYSMNEIFGDKYEIHANIPAINVNQENVRNIDREILNIFYNKLNSIISNAEKDNTAFTIYTVNYTAYLNENILSLVIKANLKEGDNAQRVIIQTYTYNLSTNKQIDLKEMLEIKGKSVDAVQKDIKDRIQEYINYANNMSSLGYDTFKRNINDQMYNVDNSSNYLLGPNGKIYIIYAYGNSNYTSEHDVVVID